MGEASRQRTLATAAKRGTDILGAAVGLIALAPLLAGLALLVKATSRGPAFYRQTRIGRLGRPFTVYKLRTMHVGAHERRRHLMPLNDVPTGPLFKVRNDPRVTRIGRVLRRCSLDELPQLWNVLTGTMSIVGPRPALPEEVARYEPHVYGRLLVKPGITGLWQVSGRSDLSWDESVRLDLYYARNWSFALDAQILLRTVVAVLSGRGAY
ncbi:MAG TPA: sugar transferase [Jatrophihabitantaceae bacterium]|nr:sugar transferase [Jatrophihabitantaceae bacterium]